MAGYCTLSLYNRAPTPKTTITGSTGGAFTAGSYHFTVVADYRGEGRLLDNFGYLDYRVNNPGTSFQLEDTAEIEAKWSGGGAGVALTLNQKAAVDWNPPDSKEQPRYYRVYLHTDTGGGYDPRWRWSLLAARHTSGSPVYSDGLIPANVTSVHVLSETPVSTSVLFPILEFDAALDEILVLGDERVTFGKDAVVLVSGSSSNNGNHTVQYSYLDYNEHGVVTRIGSNATIVAENPTYPTTTVTASVGSATFNQTVTPDWGIYAPLLVLSNILDLTPTARELVTGTIDGGKTRRAFADSKLTERLAFGVDFSGVTGAHWKELCRWARNGPDVLLVNKNSAGSYPAFNQQVGKLSLPNHYGDQEKNSLAALQFYLEVSGETA